MRHLDLFSGIGGFALAARWVGWETVGFCEIEPYCQKVLRKHWPDVPIYDDVRTLDARTVGHVDIITGGYPCQPFSVAGKRRGEADDRHLWPEFARLIRELRPRWVLGENVAGHINMGLDEVLADLEGCGYTWESFVIPACAVNAPHRRERIWIIGNANNESESTCPINDETSELSQVVTNTHGQRRWQKQEQWSKCSNQTEFRNDGETQSMANANSSRFQKRSINAGMEGKEDGRDKGQAPSIHGWWNVEPNVGRVANGIPKRVDRLKGLGNAIVPQVAEAIFRAIDNERYP